MLTTFEQVKDWITDNGFKRWVLYRDRSRTEKIIDSNAFSVSNMEDKLSMTEKYLRMSGGNALAAGSTTGAQSELNTIMEIRLRDEQPQGAAGIGMTQDMIGAMRDSITNEIRAQIKAEQYEADKKRFEQEKKEFEEEKKSAMGALIHYFAPIGQMILERKIGARVAGVDTEEPVHAAPIVPDEETAQEKPQEEEVFSDEEADRLFALMKRFKKVEPDYLVIIEKEVEMAEAKDPTYTMAKGFLTNK